MTRKEFEDIKERHNNVNTATGVLALRETYFVNLKKIAVDDKDALIQALENGGIEDEPDENDEPELAGCPFCPAGTSALIADVYTKLPSGYEGRYLCSEDDGGCGASCKYSWAYDEKTVKQNAAEIWNTRATKLEQRISAKPFSSPAKKPKPRLQRRKDVTTNHKKGDHGDE